MNEPATTLEGPAFTRGVKVLASLVMAGLLVYAAATLPALIEQRWSWPALLFLALVLLFVAVGYVSMLRSRTSVDAVCIRQSWMSDKRVALGDIRQIKLIYIPGLTWLIAPRLIVRTGMPGSLVFHTADPAVLAAFLRLSRGNPPLG